MVTKKQFEKELQVIDGFPWLGNGGKMQARLVAENWWNHLAVDDCITEQQFMSVLVRIYRTVSDDMGLHGKISLMNLYRDMYELFSEYNVVAVVMDVPLLSQEKMDECLDYLLSFWSCNGEEKGYLSMRELNTFRKGMHYKLYGWETQKLF